jgi:hypothetical protein
MPNFERVPLEAGQHRRITFSCGQISGEKSDRSKPRWPARCTGSTCAQSQPPRRHCFPPHAAPGPANPCNHSARARWYARRNPLFKLKADDVRPIAGVALATKHTLDVSPRTCLIAQKMQRDADHPICDVRIRPHRSSRPRGGKAFRSASASCIAVVVVDRPQAPQGSQLIVDVTRGLRDFEGRSPGRCRLGARGAAYTSTTSQCGVQFHLALCVRAAHQDLARRWRTQPARDIR